MGMVKTVMKLKNKNDKIGCSANLSDRKRGHIHEIFDICIGEGKACKEIS